MKNKVLDFLNVKIKELESIEISDSPTSCEIGSVVDFLEELSDEARDAYNEAYIEYISLYEEEDDEEDHNENEKCGNCVVYSDGWCNVLSDTVYAYNGACDQYA